MQRTGTCGTIQWTLYKYSRKVLWQKTLSQGNSSDASQDEMTVKEIISVYRNHLAFEKCICPLKINFICHTQAQVTLIK